ncbi:ricin-type beta-trefoil lectin domain protein [Nonomuraea sp. NPDC050783]|uniref:RICIN domain-containing protein n=1 Tax=Nonomuraea sp. NPDC050783 TaxID=3154634 RepID=UPI003466E6E6
MSKLAGTTAAILSGLCLLGSAVAAAAPASAAGTAGRSEARDVEARAADFRLYNSGSGRCLINSGGSVSGTFTGSCSTGVNRYWYGVEDIGGGRIVNRGTGRCLTAGTTSAWTAPCNGQPNQVWIHAGLGLVQNAGLGVCLVGATTGGGVFMASCNSSNVYHRWGQI